MKRGLVASLALHAGILATALIVLPTPHHEPAPVEAISVDISKIADANKLMATAKDAAEKVETPAPKKAEIIKKTDETIKLADKEITAAKEAKAPPPPPPPPSPPKPEPPKDQPKKAEPPPPDPTAMTGLLKKIEEPIPAPKQEEPKKAEEKPKPVQKPEKKPEKKVAKLDTKMLEDILNSDVLLNKENEQKTTNAAAAVSDGNPVKGERDLQGKDQALTATTLTALVQKIRECWVIPPGAREGNIMVRVRFQLNEDGSVAGEPQIMNGPGDFLFETTARSTVAAILDCQNYDFLPPDRYDLWKDIVVNFNPNMFAATTPTQ